MIYMLRVVSPIHNAPIFKRSRSRIGLLWQYYKVVWGINSVYGKHGKLKYVKAPESQAVVLFTARTPNAIPVPILIIGIYKNQNHDPDPEPEPEL
jgi:hypothetical protein